MPRMTAFVMRRCWQFAVRFSDTPVSLTPQPEAMAGGALAFVNTLALSDDGFVIRFEFNRAHLGHGEAY